MESLCLTGYISGKFGLIEKATHYDRFPGDYMFQLTKEEFDNLKFQIGTSSWGGTRIFPGVLSEQGVAMLSSVLHSKRAIMVNIQIIRVFTRIRNLLETHSKILYKLALPVLLNPYSGSMLINIVALSQLRKNLF